MDELTFLTTVKKQAQVEGDDMKNQPGYLVKYQDGYTSWSPKDTFEAANREISDKEMVLINGPSDDVSQEGNTPG